MPITFSKRNNQWLYQFNRVIAGQRHRANRLLPKGWTQAQAQKFDQQETARLYALAAGVSTQQHLIDDAVLLYLQQHAPSLKNFIDLQRALANMQPWYTGQPITALADVAKTYTADHAGKLAPATIRNRIAYLRSACRWAWKHHSMGAHDPAEKLVMPKVKNERQVYLSRAEMLKAAGHLRRERDQEHSRTPGKAHGSRRARAALRIAFYSGLRVSEQLRAKVIQTNSGLAFELQDTKNGDPRNVPVHNKIIHILRNPALWPIGLHPSTTSHYIKTALIKSGFGHARLHDMRHSAASAMINAGVGLYTIGGVLGHKSPASTKRYSHLDTTTLAAAVRLIGKKVQTNPQAKAA